MIGTWLNQTDATETASGPKGEPYLEHRRRPVTRSQSSTSAATPSAAKQSAARTANGPELQSADALFSITAYAPPDGNTQRHIMPAISACHADGAPAPSGTRLKVILYPLPRPGHGYLSLRWPVSPDAGAAGDAPACTAPRASIVAQTGACGDATAPGDSVAAAPSSGASSGQQAEHGSGGASDQTTAQQTRLEQVIQHMNRAAYALTAVKVEPRTQEPATQYKWLDVVMTVLCSAAGGAGEKQTVQPKGVDDPPRGAGQKLLRRALRGSAMLQEVSRRHALLREGALLMLCFACTVIIPTVPELSSKSRLITAGCTSSLRITLP